MRIKVVLDANVFASSLMKPDGIPASVLKCILENHKYELAFSQPILEELKRILFYPKVRKRIHKSDQEILTFLDTLVLLSHFIEHRHTYDPIVLEDPDDDIYLWAALESSSHYLVSGDQHLLSLIQFESLSILKPSDLQKVILAR